MTPEEIRENARATTAHLNTLEQQNYTLVERCAIALGYLVQFTAEVAAQLAENAAIGREMLEDIKRRREEEPQRLSTRYGAKPFAHDLYEYAVTSCPRKQADTPPEGEGWEEVQERFWRDEWTDNRTYRRLKRV
jgi:hypothetical protein